MRRYAFIYLIFCSLNLLTQNSRKGFVSTEDLFGTRTFIENNGQFNNDISEKDKVLYVYNNGEEKIYFTNQGLIYKMIKTVHLTERQKEEIEHGNKKIIESIPSPKEYYIRMNWLDCNPNPEIQPSIKQMHYFTFGSKDLNSNCFKKITYFNIYNGVDIEYTIPENKKYGIKYTFIIHPGANPENIKIKYSGDINKIIKRNGEIIIKTPLYNITEHSINSYYENNTSIKSVFTLNNNLIGFAFPNGYNQDKTLFIDPWVTTLTTLPGNNYGYDVDSDYLGNLYVYGGGTGATPYKVAKFDASGNLLWTFWGILASPSWNSWGDLVYRCTSNLVVDYLSSKVYIGIGYISSGTRIIRLDPNGNYDNFISSADPSWTELHDMKLDCNSGNLLCFGGGTSSNKTGGILDQNTGSINPISFIPSNAQVSQDIVGCAVDDAGNSFVKYTTNILGGGWLAKINTAFTSTDWLVSSSYNAIYEIQSKNSYVGSGQPASVAFNCLAVNKNYLYFYDGSNLVAYNKINGNQIAATIIPGQNILEQGGIAVDDCDNIYLGSYGDIEVYNFNGSSFNAISAISLGAPGQYVYDIKLNKSNNQLSVCGSNFIGSYSASISTVCSNSQFSLSTTCIGYNNGTAVVSVSTTASSPLFDYIWVNNTGTLSTTYNSPLTTNTITNLTFGTYSVIVRTNGPCNVNISTFSINCVPCSLTAAANNSCTGSGNTTSLSIISSTGFTSTPSYTWTGPGSFYSNVQNPSFLSNNNYGTYSVVATDGNCTYSTTVNTAPLSFAPMYVVTNPSCNGGNNGQATAFVLGGIAPYTYTWSTIPIQNTQAVTNLTSGIYTCSITDSKNCISTTTVFVSQPAPFNNTLTISSPSACIGNVISYSGNLTGGTGPYTYSWSAGPTGSASFDIQTVPGVYNYTLFGIDSKSCVYTQTFALSFIGPTLTLSPTYNVCLGNTLAITANGANTYTWNTGTISSSIIVSPTANINYTVMGKDLNGCSNTASTSVIVNSLPTVAVASPSTACLFSSVCFTASGANTYQWNGPCGFTSSAQSPCFPVFSGCSCTFFVTGTDTNNCSNTATVCVNINSPPSLTVTSSPSIICTGQTATLNVSGASSYTWSTGSLTSSTSINPSITTNYSVTGSLANGCSSTSVITQYVSACTDISSNNLQTNEITIFPNPTNGIINVEFKYLPQNFSMEIFNTLGEIIFQSSIREIKTSIDNKNFSNGLYILKILDRDNIILVKKIIKY